MFLFRNRLRSESVFEMKVKRFWNEKILCAIAFEKILYFFVIKKNGRKKKILGWHARATILHTARRDQTRSEMQSHYLALGRL